MKRIAVVFIALFCIGGSLCAQVEQPVTWSFASKKLNATTFEIRLTAQIESGWHIYSQSTPAGGPVPTEIRFAKNPLVALPEKVKEVGKLEQKHEPLFGVDVKQYSKTVVFVQKVSVKGKAKTSLNGVIEYMTCNEEQCLPPAEQKFTIALH
jgi:DsbC/DsbD-like thiol-disulfide interchange protein